MFAEPPKRQRIVLHVSPKSSPVSTALAPMLPVLPATTSGKTTPVHVKRLRSGAKRRKKKKRPFSWTTKLDESLARAVHTFIRDDSQTPSEKEWNAIGRIQVFKEQFIRVRDLVKRWKRIKTKV